MVRVENDQFSVQIWLRDGIISGVTKIEGACGATGPLDYGAAPYVLSPGTTWAPAAILEMLGHTITLDGTTLNIQ